MLKQKVQNIPLSRDGGQCAAVVRGVRKFSKLPTLPYTIRSQLKPVTLFIIGKGILFSQGCTHTEMKHQERKKNK